MENRVLMIGVGNNGRGDDALGWKFIDEVGGLTPFELDYRYQLQIEDAALMKDYETVIFIDASFQKLKDGFAFSRCEPKNTFSFSTHRIDPGSLLWLCQELYGCKPKVYLMAIEGIHWELHFGLSDRAQQNFEKAVSFFKTWLLKTSMPLRQSVPY